VCQVLSCGRPACPVLLAGVAGRLPDELLLPAQMTEHVGRFFFNVDLPKAPAFKECWLWIAVFLIMTAYLDLRTCLCLSTPIHLGVIPL
jgi:hypothetical protein